MLDANGELSCCDAQNPRHRPLVEPKTVDLFIKPVPEFKTQELMAKHEGKEYEINLCELCYEYIIMYLLRKPKL